MYIDSTMMENIRDCEYELLNSLNTVLINEDVKKEILGHYYRELNRWMDTPEHELENTIGPILFKEYHAIKAKLGYVQTFSDDFIRMLLWHWTDTFDCLKIEF